MDVAITCFGFSSRRGRARKLSVGKTLVENVDRSSNEFNNLFVQKEFDDQSVSSLAILSADTSELPIIEPTHSRAIHPTGVDSRHCTGSYQESSCISSVSCFVKKIGSLNLFLECALSVKKEIIGHSRSSPKSNEGWCL